MKKIALSLAGVALAAAFSTATFAQDWPNKPIRVISPVATGSLPDVLARIVNEKMQAALGQPIVLDYRTGAGGNVGNDFVAKSTDGHTLLFGTPTLAIYPSLYKQLTYDPLKDLAPISLVASGPVVLYVSGKMGVNNVADLIKAAKEKPGQLNFASAGIGSVTHLTTVLFNLAAGLDVQHVPYKGISFALADMVQGQVHYVFNALGPAAAFLSSGEVKLIAVTSARRLQEYPDLPTVGETIPGFDAGGWYGYFAPSSMPQDVRQKLNKAIVDAVKSPEIQDRILKMALFPHPQSLDEAKKHLETETAKWTTAVKASGTTAD